jgi:cystathionine gamma-synthase
MESFLAVRGVRTLGLRYERAQTNAEVLARRLFEHPMVERVRYPGLVDDEWHARAGRQMSGAGFMVSFEVLGGAPAAEAVARSTQLIVHATSLGGIETTIERRHRWPGEETTPPALLRMSVGCEHVEDLWRDLDHGLRIGAYAAAPGRSVITLPGLAAPRPAPGEPRSCPMEHPRTG